ncbi:MAG: gliding motility-associated protein GldE [Vicingaceae bacterium]
MLVNWFGVSMQSFSTDWIVLFVIIIVLLASSGLISGSEVAFFRIGPYEREALRTTESAKSKLILQLLDHPRTLLATILVANNFVNIGVVILSSYVVNTIFVFGGNVIFQFVFEVVIITVMLLLIGEVLPKVYAMKQGNKIAGLMALPLLVLSKLFYPIIYVLIKSSNLIEKRIDWKEKSLSSEDLSRALELTSDNNIEEEDQKILEGIVKFGNTDVKQIMVARIDVLALDIEADFKTVLEAIHVHRYSRIPVFRENFDAIEGVLYIKDLLPYLEENDDFKWGKFIRKPFFVPENKKLDDLLKEFQEKKIHLAVVVDEYGGSSGIVTMEDIMEEIVGDISDEIEEENIFTQLDENTFIFDGKTPLIDFYKVLDVDEVKFENAKGESDTMAGFVVEITGRIPKKMEKVRFENILFTIESANVKRVKEIKVSLVDEE